MTLKELKSGFLLITGTLLMLFSSCRKNEDQIIENPDGPPTLVLSSVYGVVTDKNGNSLSNVKVSYDNTVVYTDQYGIYLIKNKLMNTKGAQLKFEKNGHFTIHRTFYPSLNNTVKLNTQMVERVLDKTFESAHGVVLIKTDKSELNIPANSIVDRNGKTYQGSVNLYSYYLDPSKESTILEMPGNLTGRALPNNEFVVLNSMGMLTVELEDPAGNPLNIKADAKLKVPVPPSLKSIAKATIPTWWYDEKRATWIEEGEGKLEGDYYTASVKHFTTWNWDFKYKTVELKFRLIDKAGNPLREQNFDIQDLTNFGHGSGSTDNQGRFAGYIPENSKFDFFISFLSCNLFKVTSFSTTNQNIDLGDIVVSNPSQLHLKATVLDCNGNPVKNGLLLLDKISASNQNNTFTIPNGILDLIFFPCNQNPKAEIKIIDLENLKESKIIEIDLTQSALDLGTIMVCEGLDEYINVDYGNTNYVYPDIYFLDSINVDTPLIVGQIQAGKTFINLSFPNFNLGTNSFTYVFAIWSGGTGRCDKPCKDINYTITKTGNIGEYVEGIFSGDLKSLNSSNTTTLNGRFRFKRR